MTIIPIRRQEPLDSMWGILSAFADDPERPLPKDPDSLTELLNLTEQAMFLMRAVRHRVELELWT